MVLGLVRVELDRATEAVDRVLAAPAVHVDAGERAQRARVVVVQIDRALREVTRLLERPGPGRAPAVEALDRQHEREQARESGVVWIEIEPAGPASGTASFGSRPQAARSTAPTNTPSAWWS